MYVETDNTRHMEKFNPILKHIKCEKNNTTMDTF